MGVIRDELNEVKTKYADGRRTRLVEAFEEKEPEPLPVQAEETLVYIAQNGFVKRMSQKAFEKAEDAVEVFRCDTESRLLFFTNAGFCYPVDVKKVPECKPKDRGIPQGGLLAGLETGEAAVSAVCVQGAFEGKLLFVTENGQVKRAELSDYAINRGRFAATGIKDGDRLKAVMRLSDEPDLLLISKAGMAVHFTVEEIPVQGRTAAGVKGMGLAQGDSVAFVLPDNQEGEVVIVSEKGYMKRCLLIDFDLQARGGKGVKCFNFRKNGVNGSYIAAALPVQLPYDFTLTHKTGDAEKFNTELVKIERKDSPGTLYAMCVLDDIIISAKRG